MEHRIYLPHMRRIKSTAMHGIAMAATKFPEDLAACYAEWFCVWGPSVPKYTGYEGVPMIRVIADIGKTVRGHNSRYLQGFNEPDLWGPEREEGLERGYDPDRAAYWWEILEREYPNHLLIAPAVAWFSFEWLQNFLEAFNRLYGRKPRLTGIGVHNYADLRNLEYCINIFSDIANEWGIPEIWLSEIALPHGVADVAGAGSRAQVNFIEPMIDYCDSHPLITRYAWYANRIGPDFYWCEGSCATSILFDFVTGEPTPAGLEYMRIGKKKMERRG